MRSRLVLTSAGIVGFSLMVLMTGNCPEQAIAADANAVSYSKDVQPILSANCYGCHNAKKKKAGIDLQSGFTGVQRIVTPSKPDDSKLIKCLIGKGAKPMPPKSPLPDEQVTTIKNWIAAGAKEK